MIKIKYLYGKSATSRGMQMSLCRMHNCEYCRFAKSPRFEVDAVHRQAAGSTNIVEFLDKNKNICRM